MDARSRQAAPSESLAAPPSAMEAFEAQDSKAVWRRYCGFLDLSLQDFMEIQEQLLLEHIALVRRSPLGRRLLRGVAPKSVAEFRANIPLTTYGDYVPFLAIGQDDSLSEPPAAWAHTTGAQADFKYVPYTRRGLERLLDNLMAAFILAAASRPEEVNVWPGATVLYNTPERPYVSGLGTFGMAERFGFRGVLHPEVSEHLDFRERVRRGFREGLNKRIDVIVSMTSVLVKVGEGFTDEARRSSFDRSMLRPLALYRLSKAYLKSKLFRRQILPKDLWPTKAIIGWGIDTPFFREKVAYYWGSRPFELYACTEGGIMGMQGWRKEESILNPYADFFEFIPMEESLRSRGDARYQPKTVLLNEVVPGETYEVVITNFYGMAFIRYRVGHFVQFIPAGKGTGETVLPQFTFLGRSDDRIDLAGFTRLDAKSIWEALNLTELRYHDWTARKEYQGDIQRLHMYIELRQELPREAVEETLHQKLQEVDPFYRDLEAILGIRPIQVTVLPIGTFDRFYDLRQRAGAELGRLTPPHMNSTGEDVRDLLKAAEIDPPEG